MLNLNIKLLVAVMLVSIAMLSAANRDKGPPITNKTLVGRWEGVTRESTSVYKFQMNPDGTGRLALGITSLPPTIFELRKKQLTNDGEVTLEFQSVDSSRAATGKYVVVIRGTGAAVAEGGVIKARISIYVDSPSKHWETIDFYRGQKGYIETLYLLSKQLDTVLDAKAR